MTVPSLRRLQTLCAKTETTVGTKVSTGAADGGFHVFDATYTPNIDVDERECQGSFDYIHGVPAARGATIAFKTDLTFAQGAEPAWASVLFPACAYVGSGSTYKPKASGPGANSVTTLTISCYIDGKVREIFGAMGTFKFAGEAGRVFMIEWEFQGCMEEESTATLPEPTYPTQKPARFADSNLSWNGTNLVLQSMTLDAGNDVVMRETTNTVEAYISAVVTNQYGKITANPEMYAADTRDTDWFNMTEGVFSTVIKAADGLGTCTINVPKAQMLDVAHSDRNGINVDDVTWGCNKNGANKNESVSIAFA